MQVPEFTVEHLKKLPLRAIVAFAARCARRVEQLAQLPEGHPQRESRRAAVEAALCVAEAYATGSNEPPDESALAAVEAARRRGQPGWERGRHRRRHRGGERGGGRVAPDLSPRLRPG